ncbi:hypothetical protein A0256_22385 [Mucilaginibacter sp. PAMC 26640]|nr:hypothetical protein A0256_22385 [Mucilaginibacter sp. PAMC 26640]
MEWLFKNKIFKLNKRIALWLLVLCSSVTADAQNGTYEKKASQGAYGIISFQKNGNQVTAEIFTWWNTKSAQTGSYYGKGVLKNNTIVLHSDENDPECKVTLSIVQGKIKALFNSCSTDHLTDDFNGFYNKITDAVTGDYVVTAPKAYFYRSPNLISKLKTYVLKGDKVRLDIDRVGASKQNWLYVYFTNKAGKETAGFMPMSNLSRLE